MPKQAAVAGHICPPTANYQLPIVLPPKGDAAASGNLQLPSEGAAKESVNFQIPTADFQLPSEEAAEGSEPPLVAFRA